MQQVGARRIGIAAAVGLALAAGFVTATTATSREAGATASPAATGEGVRAALTVAVIAPEHAEWPQLLPATGDIAAWQEAVIASEIGNFRLTAVNADVGDQVRKGQLLASIADDTLAAELAQSTAAVAEAQAGLQEARANAERARGLRGSGAMSEQQIRQYLSAEQTAAARLQAARAGMQADRVRLAQTRVVAPYDGVISARSAALGSLAQAGQPLFHLIRGGRLEWRAEVPEAALGRLAPGTRASLTSPDGSTVTGKVRTVAPTVDPASRNGIAYVDLQPGAAAGAVRAGMFARGQFELGNDNVLTLPQSAVLLNEGFAYVFRVDGAAAAGEARVAQVKVQVGRRLGGRIEVTDGLAADARVVAQGVGFLADGDTVRIAAAPAAAGAARP